MMATVPHVTSGLGLRKFQADGFFLTRVYIKCAPNGIPLRLQNNWAIILQYFTLLNYELFCKHNGIPFGAHFIYLKSGSLLGLKMAKK